jgi:predicted RNase H-like HicB family nuclease
MKDSYVFPAVLSYADDGISIAFPDLPGCIPCAHSTEDSARNARSALGMHLWGMERDGESIPEPSEFTSLALESGEIPLLVDVFMPPLRQRLNNRVVRKTLTIPQWLNAEAERVGVNFSLVLQNGLKELLRTAD